MKKKHVVMVLLILILAPVAFLLLTLATWDLAMSFQVMKLSSPPKSYFEITAEDFQKFPVLKDIMEDLESLPPGEGMSYELDLKTGNELADYLLKKQSEAGTCSSYTLCFKYGNECYGADIATP
ncbi:hypothetical protein [Archaeoglobus sp.]